jgi:NADPH2:quinone reductase
MGRRSCAGTAVVRQARSRNEHPRVNPAARERGQKVRAVTFAGAGGNDVISVEERPDPVPGQHEVVVAARYAGINWADVMQREGNYPPPPGAPPDIPGLEVAGVAAAIGEGVRAWQVGDRVFGLVGGGGLADRVAAHERHLAAVPTGLADELAAAAPEAFITAHDAIFTQCGLRLGETLLVNGANGAVGSAGARLGLAAGARVVANVRSPDSARSLAEEGALVVTPDRAAATVRALGGADVVLELIGAPNLDFDFSVLAPQGRIVVVGIGAGEHAGISLGALMGKRAVLRGTVLRARPLEDKAAAVQAFARSVVPLLAAGRALPEIERVFPAAEVAAAFDHLVKPGKSGKILLDFA